MTPQYVYQSLEHADQSRYFISGVLNRRVTPFIQALSFVNKKDDTENAAAMADILSDYIGTMYRTLRYFNATDNKTLDDYMGKDGRGTSAALCYLMTELHKKHPEEFHYLLYSILITGDGDGLA